MNDKPMTATEVNWRNEWAAIQEGKRRDAANEALAKALEPFLQNAIGGIHDQMNAVLNSTKPIQ